MTETIRRARVGEAAELEALQMRASLALDDYRESLLAHPEAVTLPRGQIERGHVLVATDGEHFVGFAAIDLRDDRAAQLDGLFVDPDRWREGIGRRLVEAVRILAQDLGSGMIHVVANPTAENFYRRCGFTVTGSTQTQFGPGLLMMRPAS